MKKIINGVRYDSEKGIEIASADSGHYQGDLDWWEETLYKAPRSERYFIIGEGGPRTHYSRRTSSNSWSGGSDLRPVEKDEALRWLEENKIEITDEIATYFSDMIQDA